ncbi:MAG TPA: ABC transporter permease [Gemmataceae bacterium]
MNWQHLWTFLWLRWRLRINQLRRGGIANVVIQTILLVAAFASAGVLFVSFLSLGLFALKDAQPAELMYVLDGIVLGFLLVWATGLLTELQRSEALSLEKFLHLPVSLSSAFLINYLSSLPSLSLLWFLSAMLGLNLGLLYSRGLAMLLLLPMLAAFVLMVTALTYQFQGWLATLMANPRRRRTIIVTATMFFILLCQLPNLVNILRPWENHAKQEQTTRLFQEQEQRHKELARDLETGKISPQEYQKRQATLDREFEARFKKEKEERIRQTVMPAEDTIRLMNLLLPPGWLPVGLEAAAEGWLWPILLAILGPSLIGSASLWRAYHTTMRLYTGQYTSGKTAGVPARSVSEGGSQPSLTPRDGGTRANLLEKNLPWLSEQASVITLAAFRSLVRAPEAKMLLLSPLLMLIVFGSMFFATARADVPEAVRPLIGFGAMVMVLFSMSGLLGNQFGFDRDGFRVFVLSPARRRDILLGKNLAIAPIAFAMAAVAAALVQVVYPMRADRFLAFVPRFVSMYLLYCIVANVLSILVPMRIAPGSMQPSKPGGLTILLQLVFMFSCPILMSLTLLPVGIELAAEAMGLRYVPLDLLLSLVECAAIGGIYILLLGLQGDWLQAREQKILQIVTTKAN